MSALRILIADDEYWVRENLKGQLAALGGDYEILEPAMDGEHALTRVEVDRPDLLITDIDMPFVNGNQLIKALRPRYPDLQMVVLSGYSDFTYVREALLDGAVDYLLKPITPDDLKRVLSQVAGTLERRRAQDLDAAQDSERVHRAQSLLKDEALSALLQEGEIPGAWDEVLGLHLSVYTLVLVHVLDPTEPSWNSLQDLQDRALRVKGLLTRELSGSGTSGVFQNLLVRHEYLVLTDCRPPDLDRLARRLSTQLGRLLGVSVEVSTSDEFYALAKVAEAYRQAQAGLGARTLGSRELVVLSPESRRYRLETRVTAEHEMLLGLAVAAEDAERIRQILFDQVGLGRATDWRLAEIHQTVEYLVGFLTHRTKVSPASRLGLVQETLLGQVAHGLRNRSLTEITTVLDQWIDEVFGARGQAPTSLTMRQTVRQVKDHIQEHYFENLSLATLAESFRVDSSYLSKAYKQVTGSNLMAAIARCRIEKAKESIRDRDLSLTEVSALVGYEDYAYFNRVFRKVEGQSPTEYKIAQGRKPHDQGAP